MNSHSASPHKSHGRRLSTALIAQIRRDLTKGLTQTQIAARRAVSQATVSRISHSTAPRLDAEPRASLLDMDFIEHELDALRGRVRANFPANTPDAVLDLAVAELLASHMPSNRSH